MFDYWNENNVALFKRKSCCSLLANLLIFVRMVILYYPHCLLTFFKVMRECFYLVFMKIFRIWWLFLWSPVKAAFVGTTAFYQVHFW